MAAEVGAIDEYLVEDSVWVDVVGDLYEPEGVEPASQLTSAGVFRAATLVSDCVDRIHDIKSRNLPDCTAVSLVRVTLVPHSLQRQRERPEEFSPFLINFPPQIEDVEYWFAMRHKFSAPTTTVRRQCRYSR